MIYAYIRVSSDKQTVENQRFEIEKFCKNSSLSIDLWIEETISGTKDYKNRKLGKLIRTIKRGDILICSEISRLGRTLFMIMDILHMCLSKGAKVWTIKDNYRLGDDIQSKVLAFAFALSAEIERTLISQRTKEALQRKKNQGVKLGRPNGKKPITECKLYKRLPLVQKMLDHGFSKSAVAKKMKVSRTTLYKLLKSMQEDNVLLNGQLQKTKKAIKRWTRYFCYAVSNKTLLIYREFLK